jgi:hypothetical protein
MTIHICREEMREVSRRSDGERFCFSCRTRREFLYIVDAPVGMSCYGPSSRIECETCSTVDGDVFPGREREWMDA